MTGPLSRARDIRVAVVAALGGFLVDPSVPRVARAIDAFARAVEPDAATSPALPRDVDVCRQHPDKEDRGNGHFACGCSTDRGLGIGGENAARRKALKKRQRADWGMGGQLATGLAGITLDAASAATPSPRIVELIRFHGVPVTVSDLHGHGLQAVANAMTDAAMTEAREADLAEAVALLRYFVDWVEGALCVVAESRLPSDPDLVARRADVEGARAFLSRHPAPEVGS